MVLSLCDKEAEALRSHVGLVGVVRGNRQGVGSKAAGPLADSSGTALAIVLSSTFDGK